MRNLNLKGVVIATAVTVFIAGHIYLDKIEEKNHNEYVNNAQNQIVTQQELYDNHTFPTRTAEKEVTYFEDAKDKLKELASKDNVEEIKTKGKEYIITGIDFIFYNQPINGIYFNDLTDDAKKSVIKSLKSIDSAIVEYYPNYKEEISSKYTTAAAFIDEKYIYSLDKIKEFLGEENFEAIGNAKDELKESTKDTFEETSSYVKKKYNEWKNK